MKSIICPPASLLCEISYAIMILCNIIIIIS